MTWPAWSRSSREEDQERDYLEGPADTDSIDEGDTYWSDYFEEKYANIVYGETGDRAA